MTFWIGQAVDPNAGMTERADRFAMPTVGLEVEKRRFYLLDMVHDRYQTTDQPKVVTENYLKWRGPNFWRVGLQTIFYETDLYRHLLADGLVPLYEIPRRAGKGLGAHTKYTLLTNLQYRYEAGQVIHPGTGGREKDGGRPDTSAVWLPEYEDELLKISFEGGIERHAHDDQVEAVALAIEMLSAFLIVPATITPQYSTIAFR